MAKKPFLTVVLLLSIVQVVFFAGSCRSEQIEECEAEYEQYCPEAVKKESPAELSRCLRKHENDLTPFCWKEIAGMVKQMESLIKSCKKDFLKTCAWDIEELLTKEDKEKAEEIFECVLTHWDDYSGKCQDYVRKSVPFFGVVEHDLTTALDKKKRERGKKKITIGDKTVAIVERQGDTIWYEADIRQKKVVDQYEFCPEVEEEGLKVIVNTNQPSCFYKVLAFWGGRLVKELEEKGVFEKITDDGIREEYLNVDSIILSIVNKYTSNCPRNFEPNVYRYTYKDPDVYCTKINRLSCKINYTMSYPQEGYLGCQELAACSQSGEGYREYGDEKQCAVCNAGGWLDLDYDQKRLLCRVNFKNPEDESVCPEEIIKTYHENGQIKEERYYKECRCFLRKGYTEDGTLKYEITGLLRGDTIIQGEHIDYYDTGEIKRRWNNENRETKQEFFDREGNSITQSQIYEEEQRLRREEEYKRRMQL